MTAPADATDPGDASALRGRVEKLETPAVTIDLDALERNLDRMQAYCRGHGLALRAHVKTHKLPGVAAMQLERGAVGVACQKLGEAEVMADAGITAILLTYPIAVMAWRRPG